AEPVAAGVLTTPGVAWLVRNEGFAAGVVISASHNPYHDNGVKLVSSSGMKFPDAVEAEIERAMSGLAPLDGPVSDIPPETARDLHEDFLRALQSAAFEGAHFAGMKIVLDCANGAASRLAPALFRALGAEVIAIFDRPD